MSTKPTISPPHINDGSANPPRLAIYANQWALTELPQWPQERAWTFEETLDRLAEAGYDGVQAWPEHAAAIRARGMRYCADGRINLPGEAAGVLKRVADAGADCVTLHVGWGIETDAEIDALVYAILEKSAEVKVPAYIETHRSTVTQDIWRTCELIKRIPEVRFNGDFSHYYCGHEMLYRGFEITRQYLTPILERVSFLHGRISNSQSIQIDVADGRNNPHVANFQWLWQESMAHWLAEAKPGDILIFAPELGPPSSGYSITYRDASGTMVEISDRWQQSLTLKSLAEEAFAAARNQHSIRQPSNLLDKSDFHMLG